MSRTFDFHSAGLHPGQKHDLPTRSGPAPETQASCVSSGDHQPGPDVTVKLERRDSSVSLAPQNAPYREHSADWKPPSPDQSDVSGIRGQSGDGRSSTSPFVRESTTAQKTTAGHGQIGTQAEHVSPKAQRAGRSGGSAQPTRGSTRFHHHPHVWEGLKPEIERIYMHENKSLKQLIDIMKDKGFKATPRMYKSKFEQWGFVKNNKSKDVAMMLRLQRERDAAGKTTTFQRHGKMVDIRTYMRRKGISSDDLVEPIKDADLPEYLSCLTPPPADPEHMTLPDHLHAQDVLVSCFRDLTLGWRDSAISSASFEEDFNAYFDAELCEATRDFSRACWFFSRGYTAHGSLLSQRAFSAIHLLFIKPTALGLFDLLIASVIQPDHGLSKELWKYLTAYSKAKLGAGSTFSRLFKGLEEVFNTNTLEGAVDFVFTCMESIIGMLLEHRDLAQTIAPAISFFLLGDLILFSSSKTNLPGLQRAIAASQDLIVADGTDRPPDVVRLIEPAAYLWQYGAHDDLSFELAQHALRQQDPVSDRFDWTYWVAWRVIAEHHRGRCLADSSPAAATGGPSQNPRHALARYSLEQAIDAAEARRGFGEVQVFEDLQKLEDWHREAGDAAEEFAVRRRKEAALRTYLGILQKNPTVELLPVSPSTNQK